VPVVRDALRYYSAPTDGSIPAAKAKYVPNDGTYPKGFVVGSAHAGVKASNTKYNDLALVASEKPCSAAGVFTQNAFQAAPVRVSKRVFGSSGGLGVRGVIINSGCANAVTGLQGFKDAVSMATQAGACFESPDEARRDTSDDSEGKGMSINESALENRMLVMSTGVIGQRSVEIL